MSLIDKHEILDQLYQSKQFNEIVEAYLSGRLTDILKSEIDAQQVIIFSAFNVSDFALSMSLAKKLKNRIYGDNDEETNQLRKAIDLVIINCCVRLKQHYRAVVLAKKYVRNYGEDRILSGQIDPIEKRLVEFIYLGISIVFILNVFLLSKIASGLLYIALTVPFFFLGVFLLFFPKRVSKIISRFVFH